MDLLKTIFLLKLNRVIVKINKSNGIFLRINNLVLISCLIMIFKAVIASAADVSYSV